MPTALFRGLVFALRHTEVLMRGLGMALGFAGFLASFRVISLPVMLRTVLCDLAAVS
jgi:hypothetical protein